MELNKIKMIDNILPYRFDETKNSFVLSVFTGSDNDVFKAMINIASFLEKEEISYTIQDRDIKVLELSPEEKKDNLILKLNKDGQIIYINEYACNVTGYKEDEVLGKNWFNFFIPNEDKDNISELFKNILKEETPVISHSNNVLCKDKTLKMIEWDNCLKTNDESDEELHCTGVVS